MWALLHGGDLHGHEHSLTAPHQVARRLVVVVDAAEADDPELHEDAFLQLRGEGGAGRVRLARRGVLPLPLPALMRSSAGLPRLRRLGQRASHA
jgi:hypothetical protein